MVGNLIITYKKNYILKKRTKKTKFLVTLVALVEATI